MKPLRLPVPVALTILVAFATVLRPAGAEEAGVLPPFAATVEVSVVDLAVVVRDGKGRPVRGLRPENFRITSEGLVQEITNFTEVVAAPADSTSSAAPTATPFPAAPTPAPAPADADTHIVVFLDNLHVHPGGRDRALDEIDEALGPLLDSGRAAVLVAQFHRKLEVVERFTRSRATLRSALERSKRRVGGAGEAVAERRRLADALNEQVGRLDSTQRLETSESPAFEQALALVETHAASQEHDLRRSLAGLLGALEILAGIDGRKALLYVSDAIALSPGEDAFAFLDQAFPNAHTRLKAQSFDRTREFKDVTARANAYGVTLYVLGTGRPSFRGVVGAERDRPADPRFRGSSFDDLGQTAMRRAADLLADDTGGLALVDVGNLGKALARARSDFESYYSVGFRPSGDTDRVHGLEVELVGVEGDHEVRFQRGYTVFSDAKRLEHAVLSRLELSGGEENPLEVEGELETVGRAAQGEVALALKLRIPWKKLVLRDEGGTYRGELVARLAFRDGKGKTSPVRTLVQPIELPARYYEAAQLESYAYTIELTLPPDRWAVSLALTDTVGRTTSLLKFHRSFS